MSLYLTNNLLLVKKEIALNGNINFYNFVKYIDIIHKFINFVFF